MRAACLFLALLLADYLPEAADAFQGHGLRAVQPRERYGRRGVLKPTTTTPIYSSNDDEAYYGEGGGAPSSSQGGRSPPPGDSQQRSHVRRPPPKRPPTRPSGPNARPPISNGFGARQQDSRPRPEEGKEDWKAAVDLDAMDSKREYRRPRGPPREGGDRRGGGRGGGGRGGGRSGGPGSRKTWWMSEYTQMDGELDLPLPWWVERLNKDPQEMKVAELKAELGRRGEKVSGTKAELVERLLESERRYSLADDNFVEPRMLPRPPEASLPPCYPEVYGDDLEKRLIEEQQQQRYGLSGAEE